MCPGPNIPLKGRQGSRVSIPDSPGVSGLPILAPAATFLVMLVALAGVILFFLYRKQAHVERNAVPGVGAAMFGNVGMILFFVISGFLMVLVAYVLNHPELTVLG